jgi:NTP pyrophosphatase (non-canonical NTP hydrolase)
MTEFEAMVMVKEEELEGLLSELKHLREQRDQLQKDNTREVERRREAQSQIQESFFWTVVRWHRATDNPVRSAPYLNLEEGYDESLQLGMSLVREEYGELQDAWAQYDPVEVADAIGDLVWVLCGLSARLGYDLDSIWAEIRKANYRKIGGPRREDGKLMKPPGWEPPDVEKALKNSMPLAGFM